MEKAKNINCNLWIHPLHVFRIIWIKCFATMSLHKTFGVKKQSTWSRSLENQGQRTSIFTSSHLIKCAYSMQWAAVLGVSARVHKGNFTCGGKSHIVHSKQGVTPGIIILAWPLNPSVPPSTIGLMDSSCGLSSESYSDEMLDGWAKLVHFQEPPCTKYEN